MAKRHRLTGSHIHTPEVHAPTFVEHVLHHIIDAHGYATGANEHIAVAPGIERRVYSLAGIARYSQQNRLRSGALHQRREHGGVAVTNLAGPRRLVNGY